MSVTPPNTFFSEKSSDCDPSQLQELNNAKELLKILNAKATRYKILYDVLQETLSSDTLDPTLKSKAREICLEQSCAQTVGLESDGLSQKSHILLGLINLNSDPLTYNESSRLRKAVEVALQEKHKNISDGFYKITGVHIKALPPVSEDFGEVCLSSDDQMLFELKTKLEEEKQKYLNNLLEEQRILEDMVKLRLDKLPEVCNTKVMECEVKSKLCSLQCKIVEEKTRIQIFKETSNTLAAYEELMKDIEEQKQECQRDIQYLQNQEKKYQQVSCKQFDDLLKTFIDYKTSLEKKKMINETLYRNKKL